MQTVPIPETLESEWKEFLVEKGVCPTCLSSKYVFSRGGELVCVKCGFVLKDVFNPLMRCSGVGDGEGRHDAPVNRLCFGDDLGNSDVTSRRNKYALHQVLGKRCKENLGVRVIQTKNEVMRSQETTITQRMKSYLSGWCKRFGWGEHVLLSNATGSDAKFVGTMLTMLNCGKDSKELAKGIFVLNVKKFFGPEKASWVGEKLGAKQLFIKKAYRLTHLDKLII